MFFLSARMRNFMLHSVKTKGWTQKYYCPDEEKIIIADHVAHFFECKRAQSLRGNPSIRAYLVDT